MNIGTGVGEQSSLTGGTYGDNREEGGGIYSRGKMIWRAYQYWCDKSILYWKSRWAVFVVAVLIYSFRVYILAGWYIVTYALGIFLLQLGIGFLSPQVDPELDENGPTLPTSGNDEFRPFSRKIPEFQFWHSSLRAVLIAGAMTFFSIFNVPVYWPILLLYFILLFFSTMRVRIRHMIQHKYVPWSWGKTNYRQGPAASRG